MLSTIFSRSPFLVKGGVVHDGTRSAGATSSQQDWTGRSAVRGSGWQGIQQTIRGEAGLCAPGSQHHEVIDAVQDAVREGRRVVARGGGHCLEGLADDPGVQVFIDTSLMTGVR